MGLRTKEFNKQLGDDSILKEDIFDYSCMSCKHTRINENMNKLCCEAFPKGFPIDILFGANRHTEIHKNQIGTQIFESK